MLLFTVILDFYLAKKIFNTKELKIKKRLLIVSLVTNFSVLGFFKYYNFFAGTLNEVLDVLTGASTVLPTLALVLPIGISFYTFQSLSYVIDVYRGTSTAHARLLSFASYVTLFPHQISGPLVRHNQIVPQLEDSKTYNFTADNFWRGCAFFILGLSKKILIADLLALIVSPLVTNMSSASNTEAVLAMLGYTMQLYFDFSGYSDMAVGLGLMMNIQFPQNFNSPYKARSITEFWQRWHITLSSWLKDYLYVSLGGNRFGKLLTYRNLLITMAIGGMWHGANWTFFAWGLFHGIILCTERFFKDRNWNLLNNNTVKWMFTFLLVNLGWIFFRAPDFSTAFLWLQKVFLLNGDLTWDVLSLPERHKDRFFIALALSVLLAFFSKNTWEINLKPSRVTALVLGLLFAVCLMYMGDESPFLYFQF
ncbi:MAG: MBOAT family O-acyltransferase [Oligoflexia bacterium]|nr:MBOAT family O-acyltransferase [Oligoflexia bacterium]